MSHLDRASHVIAASDTGTTIAGITFWVVVVGGYLALILFTIWKIIHAPMSARSRTLWAWLVVLAPLLGIILWFTMGRSSAGRAPYTDHA